MKIENLISRMAGGLVLLCLFATQTTFAADPFPNKPLKIIVTAAPGGTTAVSYTHLTLPTNREV